MKQNNKITAGTPSRPWKGYTLDELAHRRIINKVKQELVTEQLVAVYSDTARYVTGNTPDKRQNLARTFSRFMTYTTYGIRVYKMFRRVRNLIKN